MATTTKVTSKVCGIDGCQREVAKGTKLRLTSLENPVSYRNAVDGKLSTCKHHKICVGLAGLSPETNPTESACSSGTAKVIYLNKPFCESCHNTYLEALVAQCRPHLTTSVIDVVRRQVSTPPAPLKSPEASAAPVVKSPEAAPKPKSKKAAPKSAPPPPPPPPPPPAPVVVVEKKIVPEESDDEEEEGEEEEDEEPKTTTAVVKPPPPPTSVTQHKKDVHEDEEDEEDETKKKKAIKAAEVLTKAPAAAKASKAPKAVKA